MPPPPGGLIPVAWHANSHACPARRRGLGRGLRQRGPADRGAARSAAGPGDRADAAAERPAAAAQGDRGRNLDFLFGALKAAPDPDSAKQVESRIWALWIASGSDTANLLMTRTKAAIDGKELELALNCLMPSSSSGRTMSRPGTGAPHPLHAQGVRRRAADIRQVLTREPRHFGALSGLGMILQEFGDDKNALVVFRRVLEINPHLPRRSPTW